MSAKSITDLETETKRRLCMPTGIRIVVADANGMPVHGSLKVKTSGHRKLVSDAQIRPNMRVARFCERYARAIGAQVAADVSLSLGGHSIDGRLSIGKLMAEPLSSYSS